MATEPANGGAPPSTLAAQLVENISASAKSSRSDENTELKGLFAVIQRVKDRPELLKSTAERIEHNHMLIYVYCRVVLESAKLDDPFLDRAHLRAEALKAINFLRFTIKETPTVLLYKVDDNSLLFRGQEPLWAWLLPQLLRMLGHAQCLDLESSIEGFFQYLLLALARNAALWSSIPSVLHYLRAALTGLIDYLQDLNLSSAHEDASSKLELPPALALGHILGKTLTGSSQRTSYAIHRSSQALRQAASLAKILAYPLISRDSIFSGVVSFTDIRPWLLDSLLDLRHAQKRWDLTFPTSPIPLIELVLDVVRNFDGGVVVTMDHQNKAYSLLVLLCGEMISDPGSLVSTDQVGRDTQHTYCLALVSIAKACLDTASIGRLAASTLIDELALLSTQYPSVGPETDVWRCGKILREISGITSGQTLSDDVHSSRFESDQIGRCVAKLDVEFAEDERQTRASKKRKLSFSETDRMAMLNRQLYDALGREHPESEDAVDLEQMFPNEFEKISDQSKCIAIDLLSRVCCVADQKLDASHHLQQGMKLEQCAICQLRDHSKATHISSHSAKRDARSTFTKLVRLESFAQSRRPRIAAMISLRRFALHCDDPEFLNLESSVAGQWCLQSLHSSIRELRIAAGRTLSCFLQQRRPAKILDDLLERNRTNAIAILRSISDNDEPKMAETCIMAWGQLGRTVLDDELNLVLIKLLEYLGSNNSIISSFAFNELLNLADAHQITPRRLLEPFWKSLAYMVTKDMIHRPQRSRAIAELLQVSISDLLLLIQTYALPWLVLDRRKEVIQKIADTRQEAELWRPLLDSTNLAAILSLLLIQETDDVEAFVKTRLNDISPHFHDSSLLQLLQSEPVLIAMELLKAAGDADEGSQAVIHRALRLMATMILASHKETRPKKGNVVGRFMQSYVLGLIPRLTDVINDTVSTHPPVVEQRRCIRALEEMIKVCKSYAGVARPQISACLLSSISQDALREASLSCWAAMLMHFEEDDVAALVDTTFFIVKRYWADLKPKTSIVARNMLNFLFDHYDGIVARSINRLPSLSDTTDLNDIESKMASYRQVLAIEEALGVFTVRITHGYSGVVHQALTELVPYLHANQGVLYATTVSQRPDVAITLLLRRLLDCASKYNGVHLDICRLCTECVGLIGCLDSNQVEAVREHRTIVVLTNFEKTEEMTDFALFLLQEVLVPAFLSAADTKLQGFLSFAMQELLDRCDIKAACTAEHTRMSSGSDIYRKWLALPENTRQVVTPFLSSRYMVAPMAPIVAEYPLFRPGKPYGNWLRSFVIDLLRKGQTPLAELIFEPLTRVIRVKDLTTAEFLLPYLVLHILVGGRSAEADRADVLNEILAILHHRPAEGSSYLEKEDMRRYCHAIFRVLDYCLRWIHAKRSTGRMSSDDKTKVHYIQACMDAIPAGLIAQRAIDCNEYARALFHLEQHTQKMEQQKKEPGERTRLLEQLQDVYANIDEPDGLEGISAHLHALDINQQILSHKKAGRWMAAQTWYEMQLAETPDNSEVQIDLLNCLKQAGQHDVLLNHVEGMRADPSSDNKIMPFAVEGAWVTNRWERLEKFLQRFHGEKVQDFNISVGNLLALLTPQGSRQGFATFLSNIRGKIASSMTTSATNSLQTAHDLLLKCHVLTDLEIIVNAGNENAEDRKQTLFLLRARLDVIGAYVNDKQYVLGIQRAAMQLLRPQFKDMDISDLWLESARLARKTNSSQQSFNAILHALKLRNDAATIENAKLLWRDNHRLKAIQMLQGAFERNKFMTQTGTSSSGGHTKLTLDQKKLTAKAQLLLAKWFDAAGQTHALALREKYQQPPKTHVGWEKGHYYLGRHYKKILEAEKPLSADDQTDGYVTGEIARLVIENYVRSLNCGTKYLYQTLPRVLTLWLDLGAQVDKPPEGKMALTPELLKRRVGQLEKLHEFLDKYIIRLPAYIYYTALPQIVARITHPNPDVFNRLTRIIVKVVGAHPRQALWSLIGVMTSKQISERRTRGTEVVTALRNVTEKLEGTSYNLKSLLRMGEKLADQLLLACQHGEFHGSKAVHASLTRDLRFNHKCAPCPLVVPVESSLTATLPALSEYVKSHQAFSRDVVTIDSFLDEVLVLSSLARPRRLTARGTDGKSYMLLIKPKDDLRTDQRLMEFNGMINRSLKRDAESSRRQLYIRTYAVVPLNEECGIIEWVPGIKTMRDILLGLYGAQKIYPDYNMLKQLMEDASISESKIRIFTDDVLGRFPSVLHLWFIQQFPNPSAWFSARLRYTRSCAVMSMVGTILGLGDRHGENVNLEEGNGGVFHVDFNCLFDKGLTFAKPERVPFRLTHNMVAAMGIYGYEGPFRKSSELTLRILRQQEETLMTILESFIYDPTLDLQKEKKSSRRGDSAIKLQPQSVVDSIKRKVRGLLPNETIPLGVEGQVQELVKQAVDPRNLTAMYIGWCPFL